MTIFFALAIANAINGSRVTLKLIQSKTDGRKQSKLIIREVFDTFRSSIIYWMILNASCSRLEQRIIMSESK